jgi:hypothetical protein
MPESTSSVEPRAGAARSPIAITVLVWVVQLWLAGTFLMAGIPKLAGAESMVANFTRIGMGQWLRYVTGSIELVSAVTLFVPSLAAVGATLLIPTMLGAIITELVILGGSPLPPALLLVAAIFIVVMRRDRLLGLFLESED